MSEHIYRGMWTDHDNDLILRHQQGERPGLISEMFPSRARPESIVLGYRPIDDPVDGPYLGPGHTYLIELAIGGQMPVTVEGYRGFAEGLTVYRFLQRAHYAVLVALYNVISGTEFDVRYQ